ncbi:MULTISPECIES: hypothetical protein [Streptomyces]|uniref:Uncharacterized protein n=1 Tax=Streptomyces tsukubensis (strain DSM 42081 / NBRC 108919 / NRRL 18488 / 9993) TaxID=1114943 RepID=I2N7P8_STRT9|nr:MULTISPECIES: hypothetical protein [Streptomyces]AZK96979.1 hypothetical protein B7R87_26235 [Streptomyces tsukubensis]EIF93045.1 hypothetical protein [Streptomyces tsukubensis NRRL18488]MYS66426.1 hypothetical protein [Streptomyces sp. SID5473]QKM67041.1 hypothetical protein STSU_007545 [Streptomyces tsukubensis NRRL18488]TAI41479.1 hypothetical protein EWI31_26910 [Streptomyces tsukubensis]
MTRDKAKPTALHLLLVWAAMTAAMPMLGFWLLMAGWGGGVGAAVPIAALGVPLVLGLLVTTVAPVRTMLPICASLGGRLCWAVMVFVLGTLGAGAGVAFYTEGGELGSAGTRIALTGVPYAVAAALFVPGWQVRLGAVAVLAAATAYGATAPT